MNDEFNSSHLPEISLPTSEFNPACQIDEAFGGRLPADRAAKKAARQGKKKKKKALKVLLVTSAVAATAVTAGPLPFFEEEIAELWSEIEHGEHERHHRDSEDGEFADYWFPSLSNLEPNGYAEGWGVMDEDYIILYDDEGRTSIHLNEAWADENYNPDGIEGCRYDPDTNTLYLEDFTGTNLEANLMGNGFTISLSGENHLDSLTVWGWYYGGSVLITGEGSLYINKDKSGEVGLTLMAEDSESCLMIDSDVKLEVWGKEAAIKVIASTMEDRQIFYMDPLELNQGKRKMYTGGDEDYYTVVTPLGKPSTHVKFS